MIEKFDGEYSWLSNFKFVKVKLKGEIYPSVEHAYMSAKSDSLEWKRFCQTEINPGKVKKKSREVKTIDDWKEINLGVMFALLLQKFKREPFKSLLIKTGKQPIQEGNYWNDRFWGVCLETGVGENWLGRMIMIIRSGLKT